MKYAGVVNLDTRLCLTLFRVCVLSDVPPYFHLDPTKRVHFLFREAEEENKMLAFLLAFLLSTLLVCVRLVVSVCVCVPCPVFSQVSAMLAKACALVLEDFPVVNARYEPGKTVYQKDINVAMAVAIDGGLITPTLKVGARQFLDPPVS